MTAFDPDPPDQLVNENREVGPPTWFPPAGTVVVPRITPDPETVKKPGELLAAAQIVTLQDVRQDGSDPRDLGLTILKEDPAARTNENPAVDPLFSPAAGFDPWTERQSYTPDGRRIVVTRFEDTDAGRIERIWMADADGGNAAALPLAGRGPNDWDTDPAFSPDGTRLAFTRTSPGGTGDAAGPSRILVADVASGEILDEIRPPEGQQTGGDAQPTWSSDGVNLAFTRNHVINGNGGNKHIWVVPVADLGNQRDLSATICPGDCDVIDDSPAFSPDGLKVAFNRKDGGGQGQPAGRRPRQTPARRWLPRRAALRPEGQPRRLRPAGPRHHRDRPPPAPRRGLDPRRRQARVHRAPGTRPELHGAALRPRHRSPAS